MTNQEHLDKLKQGVEVWNQWKREYLDENSGKLAYFFDADLSGMNLEGVYLEEVSFLNANLSGAKLKGANLSVSDLAGADLSGADLSGATLEGTEFRNADLSGANLSGANLSTADLRGANLSQANLSQADLSRTDLRWTNLSGVDLSGAELSGTILGDVDLSVAKGLETVKHYGPSTIGIDTIYRSAGNIPEVFLRDAGVPDSFIDHMRSLFGQAIEYFSCFISYSSKDQAFAEQLHADLRSKGVRCWFAPEDMDIGDKIRPRIEESIRLYDKLLLVLSEYSITSNWVTYEVERALNKEPEGVPNVLYPIRLDNTVMHSKAGWADDIRRTRHIGDFTHWTNHDDYQKAFNRLLRALKAEAQKMGSRDGTTNGG